MWWLHFRREIKVYTSPFQGTHAATECPLTPPYQKVNRERGLKRLHLLTRPVSLAFTQRRIGPVIIFPGFSLTHSVGGSRGQDLIRWLSYQFIQPAFDTGRIKPVLFILRFVLEWHARHFHTLRHIHTYEHTYTPTLAQNTYRIACRHSQCTRPLTCTPM